MLLGSAPAQATDNGAWSVAPTPPDTVNPAPRNYFVLEGEPGTKIKDKVRLQNWTKDPITFKLFGADGFNTEQDGFFSLKGYDEKMTDLGRWVTPMTSQVTVYGSTQVDIPVTVKIPRNATPGDHVGGVVAMNVASSPPRRRQRHRDRHPAGRGRPHVRPGGRPDDAGSRGRGH